MVDIARPPRDMRWTSPNCPGTRGGPGPPIPGHVTDITRPSWDLWWAPPTHPRTRGGPLPPVPGHEADIACSSLDPLRAPPTRPRTRGGHRRLSWDPQQAPPAHPGTHGGHGLPIPGTTASRAQLSRDMWRTSPAHPGPGHMGVITHPSKDLRQGPAHPSRDTWRTFPARPGTSSRPGPPIPGLVVDIARQSRDPRQVQHFPQHPSVYHRPFERQDAFLYPHFNFKYSSSSSSSSSYSSFAATCNGTQRTPPLPPKLEYVSGQKICLWTESEHRLRRRLLFQLFQVLSAHAAVASALLLQDVADPGASSLPLAMSLSLQSSV
ncbi:basic proline-rich protein-like [Macrobrachium nipponense]|uniref:basic proline-rich protein-like n=1 Tax=Macrobrachium nipponense TaxID=159736 RepID=UPI0030C80CA2